MARPEDSNRRLLFVVSNDYGEYGNAMYLLQGQPFAKDAVFLLPESLNALLDEEGAGERIIYRTPEDIRTAVRAHRPDAVFLFSGYLYVNNGILSVRAFRRLMRWLHTRGCTVATSDPFLGLFAEPGAAPIGPQLFLGARRGVLARLIARWRTAALVREFRHLHRILRDAVHLYPAPLDALPAAPGVRRLPFFNPALTNATTVPDAVPALTEWLFVISAMDVDQQTRLHGFECFADRVAERLTDAHRLHARPVLSAPLTLVNAVARRLEPAVQAELGVACSYGEFTTRLLRAEYVFYWNIFSNSLFLRLLRGLPVLFFDRGHLARAVEPLLERGLQCYYRGREPRYLSIDAPLDLKQLAPLADESRHTAREVRRHLGQSPEPAVLMQQVFAGADDARGTGLENKAGKGSGPCASW